MRARGPLRLLSILLGVIALAGAALLRRRVATPELPPPNLGSTPPSPAKSSKITRQCIRVVDGDTIELDGGERVRLIGVNAPESVDPRRPVEYFGKEGAAFTRGLVEGKRVRLEYDDEARDQYNRTLAYVYLTDGTFLNAEIIRQGYGFAYTRFPCRHQHAFVALEREAREQGRGLWAR